MTEKPISRKGSCAHLEGSPVMTETRDSTEYGWLSVNRSLYESMLLHGYAGPGTPCHPDRPGYWIMGLSEGGTCLYTGVTIEES